MSWPYAVNPYKSCTTEFCERIDSLISARRDSSDDESPPRKRNGTATSFFPVVAAHALIDGSYRILKFSVNSTSCHLLIVINIFAVRQDSSDESPPRRRARGRDSDESPPRRKKDGKSSSRKSSDIDSPPRRPRRPVADDREIVACEVIDGPQTVS